MQYTAVGTFEDPGAGITSLKRFGPFTDKRQAEACVVQLARQAACTGATIEETPDTEGPHD